MFEQIHISFLKSGTQYKHSSLLSNFSPFWSNEFEQKKQKYFIRFLSFISWCKQMIRCNYPFYSWFVILKYILKYSLANAMQDNHSIESWFCTKPIAMIATWREFISFSFGFSNDVPQGDECELISTLASFYTTYNNFCSHLSK